MTLRLYNSYVEFTFRVARQDLVFDFIDIAVDRGEQLFPTNSQRLHRVLRVAVLKDHRLLNALVQFFKLLHVRFVRVDILLVFLQTHQLIFQRTLFNRWNRTAVISKV